jgi:hypothetical protein
METDHSPGVDPSANVGSGGGMGMKTELQAKHNAAVVASLFARDWSNPSCSFVAHGVLNAIFGPKSSRRFAQI